MHSEDLWKEGDPLPEEILAIPEVISPGDRRMEAVMDSFISLKVLFRREEMDSHHVDCLILYQIALRVLHIMEDLKKRQVFPGLYDLKDFYVDLGQGISVCLTHPERFQFPGHPQDYEWYPEDEKAFGDLEIFDEKSQQLADSRLIYKILVASSKGNVLIPPRETRADYSALFYRTLPAELAEGFGRKEGLSHHEMKTLIEEAILLEKENARAVRERRQEEAVRLAADAVCSPCRGQNEKAEDGADQEVIYNLFVLLRTEISQTGRLSRLLYLCQDQLELETGFRNDNSCQAFVYGDGFVQAREFCQYPPGFRVQLPQKIRDYSCAETMVIACELMEKSMALKADEGSRFNMILITDGRLKNDGIFQHALNRLQKLKKRGCALTFVYDPDYGCEACDRLRETAGQEKTFVQ